MGWGDSVGSYLKRGEGVGSYLGWGDSVDSYMVVLVGMGQCVGCLFRLGVGGCMGLGGGVIVVDCFYIALFSTHEHSLRLHVILRIAFHSAFFNIYPPKWCTYSTGMAGPTC